MSLANMPSLVEHTSNGTTLRFLIHDAPTDANINTYVNEFKRYNVKHVVRLCEATYAAAPLEAAGIALHDWSFPDGASPPNVILNSWRALVKSTFSETSEKKATIGVHCVAGLGRAPILVTIALIDAGMENLAAVELVRSKRRGAINATQLRFLKEYKSPKDGCCIM
jgi:protein tyrosine phosphatase type 4A